MLSESESPYFGASASLCLDQTELKDVFGYYDRPCLLALMCRHFSSGIFGWLTSMVVL